MQAPWAFFWIQVRGTSDVIAIWSGENKFYRTILIFSVTAPKPIELEKEIQKSMGWRVE